DDAPPGITLPSALNLIDGAVYDNLGVETAWKRFSTVLISDSSVPAKSEEDPGAWVRQLVIVLDITVEQIRTLRRVQSINAFQTGAKRGAIWSMAAEWGETAGAISALRREEIESLSRIPSRFAPLEEGVPERLINLGYIQCDASLRAHMISSLPEPPG